MTDINRTVVLSSGCYDVLHIGHIRHLEAAKKHGNYLIVSVTPDKHIKKGPSRPHFTLEKRMAMLRALKVVDEVVSFDCPTALAAIESIKPDVYIKGQDYADHAQDVTGKIKEEVDAVKKYGGRVVYTDEETDSSSRIINQAFNIWTSEQKETIRNVQDVGGIDLIKRILDKAAKLTVTVIGEPILDIYRFCEPQGVSSKSPSLSARLIRQEEYRGGSWAIAEHLSDFCNVANLYPEAFIIPEKIRYLTESKSQRIFEITDIAEKQVYDEKLFLYQMQRESEQSDLCLIADFGHGLFEDRRLEAIGDIKCNVALNVQTNSSNYGFNVFTKHKNFDYLCIDTRELRLAFNDKHKDPSYLAWRAHQMYKRHVSVTLGEFGSLIYAGGDGLTKCPAFAPQIVDTIGAGDAYFAITSVMNVLGAPPLLTTFVGNVFAGLKAQIIGNKEGVSKANLLKACTAILS